MAWWGNTAGTALGYFRLGLSGVRLKNNSGALDVRNAGDSAYASLTALGATISGAFTEGVYALSGTTPALDPANGTIQTWTLTGASTPTDSVAAGQSMTLMVDDGTAYAITWPTMTWVGGSAPTLATTGYTVIELWKVGAVLYGKYIGDA